MESAGKIDWLLSMFYKIVSIKRKKPCCLTDIKVNEENKNGVATYCKTMEVGN